EHPGVAEAAVVGTPSEEWGEQVTAFVVPADPAAPPAREELLAFAAARLGGGAGARLRRPRRPARPARPRGAAGVRRRAAGRVQAAPGPALCRGRTPERPRQGPQDRASAR